MRENRVRTIWQQGGAVITGWLHISSSFAAEIMSQAGWDALTIDLQHGPVDYQAAVPMLQTISASNVTPLARVPWNDPAIIMKMLDAGCYGIICPMVNSRAEAEAFVGACRYQPQGYRSHGPTRARLYAGADYVEHANNTVIAMPMIETAQAVENIDEILSVEGVDALYIGPADLSMSYGYPPRTDLTDPFLVDKIDRILAAAKRHNVVAGIHCGSPAYARQMIEKGFQFIAILSDGGLLANAARAAVEATKGTGKNGGGPTGPY
ncbi:MAG: aldolase/citrate lyase family protein [Anaerolineae bacterium]